MKKIISTILSFIMVLSMGITAFAAETVGQNGSQDIDVTAKYSDSTSIPDVYSVDVQWDDMTFTYSEAGTKDWNPATHTYTDNVTAGWDKDSADVTVTNHSNVAVDVTFEYTPVDTYGVNTVLSNTESAVVLPAGEEGNKDNAASTTATLSISGTPNETVTSEGVVVGTITVSIS